MWWRKKFPTTPIERKTLPMTDVISPPAILKVNDAPENTCGHCPSFKPMPLGEGQTIQGGQCRASLPKVLAVNAGEFHTIFPVMPCNEWCTPGRDRMMESRATQAPQERSAPGYDEL